jgi:parallel beta-helix repeat protein
LRNKNFKGVWQSALIITSIIALSIPLLSSRPVHAAFLTSHNPIYINGNAGFTKPDPVNGGGSGTADDPYIIENWNISAENANGIEINNTTAYFIVRNCYVHDGRSNNSLAPRYGICSENVENGMFDNNLLENNDCGIRLDQSNTNILINNTLSSNFQVGIWLASSSNNLVSNNTLENGTGYGVYFAFSNKNTIEKNMCSNNPYGIYLTSSSNNTIDKNTCENSGRYADAFGIYLDGSDNNLLTSNTCRNILYGAGMELIYSDNVKMRNNILLNNQYNFGVESQTLSEYLHNDIDISNLVNGKPIRYLIDNKNEIIGPSLKIGYLALINCDNILVANLGLKNNYQGILIAFTENSCVKNCIFENNYRGIHLIYSSNNLILGNTVEPFNGEFGIQLAYSNNNLISGNTIKNNLFFSFYLGASICNRIYHNNIVDNGYWPHDDNYNYWDNGYPSGGNYWSDYTGMDNYHGENQNIPGSDGIGDIPYSISGGSNQDIYPMMKPFSEAASVPSGERNWPLVAGIVGAIVVIGIIAAVYIKRR